jgi:uncharacterized protein (DUF4415 family)
MANTRIKRPSLKKALQRVDQIPAEMLGEIDLDLSTLPCLNKPPKEKITLNLDADVLAFVRKIAEKKNVSYASVMNDMLRRMCRM